MLIGLNKIKMLFNTRLCRFVRTFLSIKPSNFYVFTSIDNFIDTLLSF